MLTSHSEDTINESAASKALSNAADFYRTKPVADRRVHILGVGNVGTFIAHALRGLTNSPPVTLVFARYEKLEEWRASAKRLTVITDGDSEIRDGFDVEIALPRVRRHGKEIGSDAEEERDALSGLSAKAEEKLPQALSGESTEPISSLIVCSKAPHVLQGLSAVKHRLRKNSVILFMQNGMGTVEEVNREIFPDPETRPYYMVGVNSHGMRGNPDDPFSTIHAGFGTISLGILPHERHRDVNSPYTPDTRFQAGSGAPVVPKRPDQFDTEYPAPTSAKFSWTPNERYLLRTMLRAPVLSAASFSPPDLLQMQLDKLAVNCIVNPLTVLLDARNGAILNNYALTRTMRLLLAEISLVIRSLPELQYIPNIQQRFDPGKLETIVVSVAHRTRDNISSMLADVRAGRQTEIDYINGWIVKRGEELGLRCLTNYMIMQLVTGKNTAIRLEMGEDVPLVTGERGEQGDVGIKVKGGLARGEAKSDS